MTDQLIHDEAPASAPEAAPPRRARILEAAARAFATHGYRGSSLRDIARDAGCSLTLLDHHFGGKSQLLDAVLQHQHEDCDKRLQGLRAAVNAAPDMTLADFVALWVNYEFELYATPQGRLYLTLLLRLSTEAEVEAQRRRDLDCSQAIVLQALARTRPDLAEDARQAGWFLASAALYAAIVRADEGTQAQSAQARDAQRQRVIAFVAQGLAGCLGDGPG